ncbi:YoaK family protein [Streptacidiphilus sp. N1-3]|uniref:YoaK family protein n=1 Tax=Streptacidiphilus alkalitolerans TaxID=3342712 RepID=A0ABV6X5Z7_9ACTN
MSTNALRDAWATLVPDRRDDPGNRHGPLPPLLIALTVVTGLVDAFSYLVLGRVFVANMTGNVVFIAFALAGSHDFSLAASLVALLAFAVGALLGGRLGVRFAAHRGRLLLAAVVAEAVLVLASYLYCLLVPHAETGGSRYLLVVLLGLAMGTQNAAVRRLAVPDLTTTVLTLTITGIAADSRAAGGGDSKIGRRLLSALSMFLGAFLGGLAALHGHAALPLLPAAVLLALACAALATQARSTLPWTGKP